nr:MAG TPA: nucelotide kinase [Bacteriophage sp.]
MKDLTITAKDFAELFSDADKMLTLREVDNGRETGRKMVCKVVFASKSIGGKEVKKADNGLLIRPDYYNPNSAYEPRKVIKAWGLDWNLGNALKYIARCGKKANSTKSTDLEKAMTYIGFEIEDDNEVNG